MLYKKRCQGARHDGARGQEGIVLPGASLAGKATQQAAGGVIAELKARMQTSLSAAPATAAAVAARRNHLKAKRKRGKT
jgi:hypothetical protein